MKAFDLAELEAQRESLGNRYLEFLRVPPLSMGIYVLAAGTTDPQQPHYSDEVYYIVRGRARFTGGEQDRAVGPGDLIYVEAQLPHRFHTIDEDLTALVFFAPPE
jgi:mannose-6-phosphate isomerase-like protein (cupin superfamily)